MTDLHQDVRWILMAVCLAVFIGVFFVMLVSLWRQHRSERPDNPNFHASIVVEMSWALTPFAIVLLTVYPTVRAIFRG